MDAADSISYLPGPWCKPELKYRTDARFRNKGLFVEGRDTLLCHDTPLPKDLVIIGTTVPGESIEVSQTGGGGLDLETLSKVSKRHHGAARKLLECAPQIAPIAHHLSRLSPEPSLRIPVAEACALAVRVKELRKSVGVQGDEGLWQAVVQWPESAACRLLLGVEVWERTERDVGAAEKCAQAALEAVKAAGPTFPAQPISQASFISQLLPALEEKILGQKLGGPMNPPRPPFLGTPKGALSLFQKAHGALCFMREEEVWGLQERARDCGRLLVEALLALKLPSDLQKLKGFHKLSAPAQKLALKAPLELSDALLSADVIAQCFEKEVVIAKARRETYPPPDSPTGFWHRLASCPDAFDKGLAILPDGPDAPTLPSDWEQVATLSGSILTVAEREKLLAVKKCSGADADEILLAWWGDEKVEEREDAIQNILSTVAPLPLDLLGFHGDKMQAPSTDEEQKVLNSQVPEALLTPEKSTTAASLYPSLPLPLASPLLTPLSPSLGNFTSVAPPCESKSSPKTLPAWVKKSSSVPSATALLQSGGKVELGGGRIDCASPNSPLLNQPPSISLTFTSSQAPPFVGELGENGNSYKETPLLQPSAALDLASLFSLLNSPGGESAVVTLITSVREAVTRGIPTPEHRRLTLTTWLSSTSPSGMSLGKAALLGGHKKLLASLLSPDCLPPGYIYPDGCTLLHYAAFARPPPLLGGSATPSPSRGGEAVGESLATILSSLLTSVEDAAIPLQSLPVILDNRNASGATALHAIARAPLLPLRDKARAFAMLLAAGSDPLVKDGTTGKTPLEDLAAVFPPSVLLIGDEGGEVLPSPPPSLTPFALSDTFSDCLICVPHETNGEQGGLAATFPSHRVILAAASPFFASALSGAWVDHQKQEAASVPSVTLHVLAGQLDTAQRALKWPYCYTVTDLGLPPGEVGPCLSLLLAADALGMVELVVSLQPLIMSCLSSSNAAQVFVAVARLKRCERLAMSTAQYVLKMFPAVASLSGLPPLELLDHCLTHLIGAG